MNSILNQRAQVGHYSLKDKYKYSLAQVSKPALITEFSKMLIKIIVYFEVQDNRKNNKKGYVITLAYHMATQK